MNAYAIYGGWVAPAAQLLARHLQTLPFLLMPGILTCIASMANYPEIWSVWAHRPGCEPWPPELGDQSPDHWAKRIPRLSDVGTDISQALETVTTFCPANLNNQSLRSSDHFYTLNIDHINVNSIINVTVLHITSNTVFVLGHRGTPLVPDR